MRAKVGDVRAKIKLQCQGSDPDQSDRKEATSCPPHSPLQAVKGADSPVGSETNQVNKSESQATPRSTSGSEKRTIPSHGFII